MRIKELRPLFSEFQHFQNIRCTHYRNFSQIKEKQVKLGLHVIDNISGGTSKLFLSNDLEKPLQSPQVLE